MNTANGTPSRRRAFPSAPSSDSDLFVNNSASSSSSKLQSRRRHNDAVHHHHYQRQHKHKPKNKITYKYYHALVFTIMAAFVLFQIYFLHRLAQYHDQDTPYWAATESQEVNNRNKYHARQRPGAAKSTPVRASAKQPPKPKAPPPPKTSLLPKHVVTIFGPESSGTTFLSTTLGIATGAFDTRGKWNYMPGNTWTIPGDTHQFVEQTRWVLETTLGRRAQTPDGTWEIQHLSLPWGWYCEEDRHIEIVEALVPEECWRYQEDSHVSPKSGEMI